MGEGYDEPHHIDMAYVYSAEPFHFYGPGQLQVTKANAGMQALSPGYPPKESLAAAAILPRSERPSFSQLGGHAFTSGGQPNQMVQHPPLYYWMEAVVMRIPGVSGLSWDLEVWLMRLLSVLLMLPLPVLCWATARRLLSNQGVWPNAPPELIATAAAGIPLTIPNLIRDGSSVNNDTLLILTTSVLLYLLSRVVTGDRSRATAGLIALSLAAALWTKGYALVLPPLVLAAYLVGGRTGPSRRARARDLWAPVAIAAVGACVGGLWWLRNLIDYGTVQVDGFGPTYQNTIYGPPTNKGTLGHFLAPFITGFLMRVWGGIGLPDNPSPGPFIIYGWLVVIGLGIIAAILVKGRSGDRRNALVVISASILTTLVVADGSFSSFRRWSVLGGVQGRYLYSTLVGISALSVLGWDRLLQPRFRRALTPVVVIGAVVTNAVSWILILRSWYQPSEKLSFLQGLRDAIDSLLRWSPLPSPLTVFLVGVLPALTSVVTVVVVMRESRGDRGPAGQAESFESVEPAPSVEPI